MPHTATPRGLAEARCHQPRRSLLSALTLVNRDMKETPLLPLAGGAEASAPHGSDMRTSRPLAGSEGSFAVRRIPKYFSSLQAGGRAACPTFSMFVIVSNGCCCVEYATDGLLQSGTAHC